MVDERRSAAWPAGDGESRGSPDDDLVERVRAALERWRWSGEGPTSSLTGGGAIREAEQRFATLTGVRHGLAMASGTLALRAALQAVGVEAGGEVVCPALDWPAGAAAVLSLDAIPVPADCIPAGITMDPEAVEARLSDRTGAIIATHIAGIPVDIPKIRATCEGRGVPIVEDASQALGTSLGGHPVGSLGDAAIFSLGPGKTVDTGEGGMIVTDDPDVYRAAVRRSQHPTRQLLSGVEDLEPFHLSSRIHPVAAMLALAELDRLGERLRRRRVRAESILPRAGVEGVRMPAGAPGVRFSWPCVPALVDPESAAALSQVGLEASPLGLSYLPDLLNAEDGGTPNARAAHREARRLWTRTCPRSGGDRKEVLPR